MTTPALVETPAAPSLGSYRLHEQLAGLREALLTGLVERDVAVRLALLATLAGEHLLLLGPPGTAKSLIARRLQLAIRSSSYFERLLTRFTVPEELFGPLSIKGLEADRYERLVEAYLPSASIAFLDEVFKANSAILNSLLTLLNEREFDNGTKRTKTPLVAVVAASNELPRGEELDALFDRFLLRLHVVPVSKEHFKDLLRLQDSPAPAVPETLKLSNEDLAQVRRGAAAVAVPTDIEALLAELREWCQVESLAVSDRRWRKIVKLLRVSAFTNGRDTVSVWDCWLLQHCVWNTPEARTKVYDWYTARVGTSKAMDPTRLSRLVTAFEGQLERDERSRSQSCDAEGRLLYVDGEGKNTTEAHGGVQAQRGGLPLFLAPSGATDQRGYGVERAKGEGGYTRAELTNLRMNGDGFDQWPNRSEYLVNRKNWVIIEGPFQPLMEPTRHKLAYVKDQLRQLATLREDVRQYTRLLEQHVRSMRDEIHSHLWVTSDFAEPAQRTLDQTRKTVAELDGRIERVRAGFEALPCETSPE